MSTKKYLLIFEDGSMKRVDHIGELEAEAVSNCDLRVIDFETQKELGGEDGSTWVEIDS